MMTRKVTPVASAAIALVALVSGLAWRASRDESSPTPPAGWKQVEQAQAQGLPKTAVNHLKELLPRLIREKNYSWAIRALCLKVQLETRIQGNKAEEAIRRLESELRRAPKPMRPVLHTVLAHWYYQYFIQNRWRYLQRTQAAGGDEGTDITTWSLPRILWEIEANFTKALESEDELRKIPLERYKAILAPRPLSKYRPTLFDFLAWEALQFYSIGEQAAHQPADAFQVQATDPIFDDPERFLAWELPEKAADSTDGRAIRLYQRILRAHEKDDDRSAFLDADLHRLVYGRRVAVGSGVEERYVAALKRFTERAGDHPIAARAFYHWAKVLHAESKWVEAHHVAEQGVRRAPRSVGAARCRELIAEIESKELYINVERVWSQPWPKIAVTYRNLDRLYFRIVPVDVDRWLAGSRSSPSQITPQERKQLIARRPLRAWSVTLPATKDYQPRKETIDAPRPLPRGAYLILASANKEFSKSDNVVLIEHFWVSDLAVVVRSNYQTGVLDGLVVDAQSGKPLAEAKVAYWVRVNRARKVVARVETDDDGRFEIRSRASRVGILDVRYGDDRVVSVRRDIIRTSAPSRAREATYFFTDRGIYRPGQTIRYKGLAVHVDPAENDYRTISGRTVVVSFRDPNGKEISRQRHRTNEFGSFQGSFTAPSGKLLGAMSLTVIDGPRGGTMVRVEEYKRPKFRVEMDPPAQAPRLGRPVALTGRATSYTGAPIDGANVRWRVVRRAQIPYWWFYRRGPISPPGQTTEIASGVTRTDGQGRFELTFSAEPDPTVDSDTPARFYFDVTAAVVDSTGETREGMRTVVVGRRQWWAELSADEWQESGKPVEWRIRVTTLAGKGVETRGRLVVYRLRQPKKVTRPMFQGVQPTPRRDGKAPRPQPVSTDPDTWELGESVHEEDVAIDASGLAKVAVKLEPGMYRAIFETRDPDGGDVKAQGQVHVLDLDAAQLGVRTNFVCRFDRKTVAPGQKVRLVWGTGYQQGQAWIEVMHRRRVVKRFWTDANKTQQVIEVPVDESMRGGFSVSVTMVRENRLYHRKQFIDVPWTNRELVLKWEHFVSKLKPGQKETWTLVVFAADDAGGSKALEAAAELVATLYDASLDALAPFSWPSLRGLFYRDYSWRMVRFFNGPVFLRHFAGQWKRRHYAGQVRYPAFHPDVMPQVIRFARRGRGVGGLVAEGAAMADAMELSAEDRPAPAPATRALGKADRKLGMAAGDKGAAPAQAGKKMEASGTSGIQLDAVPLRKNLQETAFFFPQLRTDKEGKVRLEFTMPEALTQWKFLALAHDKQLRSGTLTDKVVTRKDLMVVPNPPRFLREGDVLEFTAKVINQSPTHQQGQVRLRLADARTDQDVTASFGVAETTRSFDIPAARSATLSWRLKVPDGAPLLIYRVVAATDRLSDGQEDYLPVLPRRILVTESLPLPIRGPGERTWEWKRLLESRQSDTLVHQSLTVQAVSQPAWYAVMALPYLMEFPYECNEQVFNRLYANLLARKIITGDPKMRRVIEQWKNTPAEKSPLEKNEQLKSILLEETPWVRQAESETQARKNLAILFDENRIRDEVDRAMSRLRETQLADGRWPWFPGGRASDYITLYLVTGFARLQHLGVEVDMSLANKALPALDRWMQKRYDHIASTKGLAKNNLTPMIALYLYARTYYLEDHPVPAPHKKAWDYFVRQGQQHWLTQPRQSQGHLALALHRLGNAQTARAILRSIREHSVTDEELGMFWRDTEQSWWWYRAPIETQALMIEAFDEVLGDRDVVDQCQVWLIKQKQTQNWKTTKATADACFALLRRGANRLASDVLLEVSLGGQRIKPEGVEAGTGFYEKRFAGPEVRPNMGNVRLEKRDPGVAWASLHWQYFEDMSKVKPYEGTPLKLRKALFVKRLGPTGEQLVPISEGVHVGDVLVVRIEVRVDRAMEYVHLKDQRPSGSEPVDVLSGYRYQDGLAYYQMTRDTATHFFIDYLPKGTYVLEYATRIQHRGKYASGIARIECMYAPEFGSHSQSVMLEVKE